MQLFSDAEIVYAIATELESSRVVLKRDVIRKVLK